MSKFDKENYSIEILDDKIMHILVKEFCELNVNDLTEMQIWVKSQSSKKDWINLIQFGNGSSVTRDAREYAAGENGNMNSVGSAILVRNLAQQLIIDYYIKFNKPKFPTAAFYKKEKALKWIYKVIEEGQKAKELR